MNLYNCFSPNATRGDSYQLVCADNALEAARRIHKENTMRTKYVYLHSVGSQHVLAYSKKNVMTWHRNLGGTVYRLSYGYFKDCHFHMDAPTFRVVGERIA
jgi:hypothetical protein